MPSIDVDPGVGTLRHADYESLPIIGSSFAAPSLLSVAIQAHQYEGWFSALAYPMVNKAVILASTRDANADGAIGKATTWSSNAPTVDAEDGAGQVRFSVLRTILDSNQYFFGDLSNSQFVSCGSNCREYVVATLTIPHDYTFRVALAWQSCMLQEASTPTLNNDLDLALTCGSEFQSCGGTIQSTTVASELEMLERPGCFLDRSCSIRIRIKNGVQLASCGSATTERVGVAWSFNNAFEYE